MAKKVQVEKWETEDGLDFNTQQEAIEHESQQKIKKIVDKFYFTGLDREDLVDAILENRNEIIAAFDLRLEHG